MSRTLDTRTLKAAARVYAGHWLQPTVIGQFGNPVAGHDWVMDNLYNATFKDEHLFLVDEIRKNLGPDALTDFDEEAGERFTPRDEELFEDLLAEKLARRKDGSLISGKVGTVNIGSVIVGWEPKVIETRRGLKTVMRPVKRPVYAGQEHLLGVGAQNMNVSAEAALAGLDALLDRLDEGTGAAVIQGRTGAQPVDPDAATTGTLLFTLVMSDPAFAAGTDQANGTVRASASTITDDASADATGTLGYCRVSATNDGATPLDDHIDGEAGTSGADFNFNTVSIVAGATVSMTSYTVTLDQGTTAT